MPSFFPRFYFATARAFTMHNLIHLPFSFVAPALAAYNGIGNEEYRGVFKQNNDGSLSTVFEHSYDVSTIKNLIAQFFRRHLRK